MPEKMTPRLERMDLPELESGQAEVITPLEVLRGFQMLELKQLTSLYYSILSADLPQGVDKAEKLKELDRFSKELIGLEIGMIHGYYPKENPYVCLKKDYREVSKTEGINMECYAVLSANKIIYFDSDSLPHLLRRKIDQNHQILSDDRWEDEIQIFNGLSPGAKIKSVQPYPGGKIITMDKKGNVSIWKNKNSNQWIIDNREGRYDLFCPMPDNRFVSTIGSSLIVNGECMGSEPYPINQIQPLVDERIVVGAENQAIVIWKKELNGTWQNKFVVNSKRKHGDNSPLQAFSDGRIYFLNDRDNIALTRENIDGSWTLIDNIVKDVAPFQDFQVLPDGRIVTMGDRIAIWDRDDEGNYVEQGKVGSGYDGGYSVEVLPTGEIISVGNDGQFHIFDGTLQEEGNG